MPSHPRIEEVEDSDLEASDPSEDDIDDFAEADIMRRVDAPLSSTTSATPPPSQTTTLPSRPAPAGSQARPGGPVFVDSTNPNAYKGYQCVYPIYFDASRSRADGRRVSKSAAVANPLASDIANACGSLQLRTVFEPTKLHPKDWANPGRVRVLLDPANKGSKRDGMGGIAGQAPPKVKNKHHLYLLVAMYLKAHPTTDDSQGLRFHARGGPSPPAAGEKWPRPAVPRGWRLNELLPFHSPAMTGGGVSENLFKEMMSQMSPEMLAAQGGPSGAIEEKRKGKKDKGKGKG